MTRRRFVFWIGMGLFGMAERLGTAGLDRLAAAAMDATSADAGMVPAPSAVEAEAVAEATSLPVHWQATHNATWRWVQREHYVDGEWRVTGMTTPVHRTSGEAFDGAQGYLDDAELPERFRAESAEAESDEAIDSVPASEDTPGPDPTSERRARHGRPPSRWLRSLNADELSLWLATVEPPEATVDGMTFAEHLTGDHGFDAERIEGLAEEELAKLHAAAHHGY